MLLPLLAVSLSFADSLSQVRQRLSQAADSVARDWWIPSSYEQLAELVRRVLDQKRKTRALPILSCDQLRLELRAHPSSRLQAMADDPQLLKRGAVG